MLNNFFSFDRLVVWIGLTWVIGDRFGGLLAVRGIQGGELLPLVDLFVRWFWGHSIS